MLEVVDQLGGEVWVVERLAHEPPGRLEVLALEEPVDRLLASGPERRARLRAQLGEPGVGGRPREYAREPDQRRAQLPPAGLALPAAGAREEALRGSAREAGPWRAVPRALG